MADKKKKLDYDLAFTHLQNNQNITAYNLFLNLAENQKKIDTLKSAVLFILAGECKNRQNKDNANEILEAGKSFLNFAKNENNYNIKNAYLCAAKCFLKARNYSDFVELIELAKKGTIKQVVSERYSLNQSNDALENLKQRKIIGRAVITP